MEPADAAAVPARHLRLRTGPSPTARCATSSSGALAAPASAATTASRYGFAPHDFRRIFITDAIMNGMPPHIAQLISATATSTPQWDTRPSTPSEAIEAHRAFITRRRQARPSEEYRVPSEEEWDEFLGHFERRRCPPATAAAPSAPVHP